MPGEIRFGPAAAPRWFDLDLARFGDYLDLITSCGATAIEFVALPEVGTEEERRVHLDIQQWPEYVAAAQARDLTVNIHWPLPPRFRLEGIAVDHLLGMAVMVDLVAAGQSAPPAVIVHGISDDPALTFRRLDVFRRHLESDAQICLESRVPMNADDHRWDRSLLSLAEELQEPFGICWDVANQWLATRSLDVPHEVLGRIRHIHLHDSRPDHTLHAPLDTGAIDWRTALAAFHTSSHWQGCLTLEIRYRYASEVGEPWDVLRDTLQRANAYLTNGEP